MDGNNNYAGGGAMDCDSPSRESSERDLIELKNTVNNFYLQDETGHIKRISIKMGDEGAQVSIETSVRPSTLRADKLKELSEVTTVSDDRNDFSKPGCDLSEEIRPLKDGLDGPSALLAPEILHIIDEKASLAAINGALRRELAEANHKIKAMEQELQRRRRKARELERRAGEQATRAEAAEKKLSDWNVSIETLATQIAGCIATVVVMACLLIFFLLIVAAWRAALSSQDPNASISALIASIISIVLALIAIKPYRSIRAFLTKRIKGLFARRLP